MADFDEAIVFTVNHANAVEQALLDCSLHDSSANSALLLAQFHDQHPSGGIVAPSTASVQGPSLNATCQRLTEVFQLGGRQDVTHVQRALDFVAGCQCEDGSWSEADANDVASLDVTAQCAWTLSLFDPSLRRLRNAASWLERRMEEAPAAPTPQTLWLSVGLFLRLDEPDTAVRWLCPLLERVDNLNAGDLACMLNTLLDSGIDVGDSLGDAADRLERLQNADGGWSRLGIETVGASDAYTTVLALRALIRLERFDSHPFFN